jgi:hypothetical protein
VDGDGIRVLKLFKYAHFALEPRPLTGIGKRPSAHDLDGDSARRALLDRLIDDGLAATVDLPDDLVAGEVVRMRKLQDRLPGLRGSLRDKLHGVPAGPLELLPVLTT